jgi:hypothetical protein
LFSINTSLEAKFFPALWVFDGYVIFSGPVDGKSGLAQGGQNILPTLDKPLLQLGGKISMNGLLGLGAIILVRRFAPAEQSCPVQVGVFRGMQTRPGRIVRSGPAFLEVVQVAEYAESLFPARREGVKSLAARQLKARHDKMQFVMPGVTVPNPEDIALIRFQTGKGDFFKIVHNALFLLRRNFVVRVPGKNARREFPLPVYAVDKVTGHVRIAAQNFRRRFLSAGIIHAHKIAGGHGAVALAVRKELYVHGSSFSSRSKQARAISTSRASARPL